MKQALRFHPADHTYTVNEVPIPGVTSVLNVLDTYAGIPKAVLDYAAKRGTAVHIATELDDAGTLDETTVADELWPYLIAWREFRRDSGFEATAVEHQVWHPKLWYAGQFDREGIYKDELALIDIKTTAQLMPSTGPQLMAYKEARNYRRADKVKRTWAVQLKDDGTYRTKQYQDPADFDLFRACLTIHNWKSHN